MFKNKLPLSLRSGVPNRSIAKAMLVDRALGQCFSTRGREIKLQYNIFTNIMTSYNVEVMTCYL